jgi:hypothetical protein
VRGSNVMAIFVPLFTWKSIIGQLLTLCSYVGLNLRGTAFPISDKPTPWWYPAPDGKQREARSSPSYSYFGPSGA